MSGPRTRRYLGEGLAQRRSAPRASPLQWGWRCSASRARGVLVARRRHERQGSAGPEGPEDQGSDQGGDQGSERGQPGRQPAQPARPAAALDRQQALKQRIDRLAKARAKGNADSQAMAKAAGGDVEKLDERPVRRAGPDPHRPGLLGPGAVRRPRPTPAPTATPGPAAQPDRQAGPRLRRQRDRRQLDVVAHELRPAYYKDLFFGKTATRSTTSTSTSPPAGSAWPRATSATGSRCPTTRLATARTSSATPTPPGTFIEDSGQAWYDAQIAAGKTHGRRSRRT